MQDWNKRGRIRPQQHPPSRGCSARDGRQAARTGQPAPVSSKEPRAAHEQEQEPRGQHKERQPRIQPLAKPSPICPRNRSWGGREGERTRLGRAG